MFWWIKSFSYQIVNYQHCFTIFYHYLPAQNYLNTYVHIPKSKVNKTIIYLGLNKVFPLIIDKKSLKLFGFTRIFYKILKYFWNASCEVFLSFSKSLDVSTQFPKDLFNTLSDITRICIKLLSFIMFYYCQKQARDTSLEFSTKF